MGDENPARMNMPIRLEDLATPSRERALRHGLLLAGLLGTLAYLAIGFVYGFQGDAYQYWVTRLDGLYAGYHLGDLGYAYSPAFAQLIAPLAALPYPIFRVIWGLLALAALLWLARPLAGAWRLVAVLLCLPEVLFGNIFLFMAAALALSLRYPAAWAFPVLSKATPAVGLLWLVGRRDWRAFGQALAAIAAVVAISFALAPDLWPRWIATLWSNRDAATSVDLAVPLALRLPVAAVIALWTGRTGRAWGIPVAVLIGLPHIWLQSFTLLIAIPRLVVQGDARRTGSSRAAGAGSAEAAPAVEPAGQMRPALD